MEDQDKYSPTHFISDILGKQVLIRLNSGIDYKGVLAALDGYMNINLEDTEEFVGDKCTKKYGDTFIRGNNGRWQSKEKDAGFRKNVCVTGACCGVNAFTGVGSSASFIRRWSLWDKPCPVHVYESEDT